MWVRFTVLCFAVQLLMPVVTKAEPLLLAATWQPGFCETRPGIPECRGQDTARFDADHFSLHGLWPQPYGNFYCGVSSSIREQDKPGQWLSLSPLLLEAQTRAKLKQVMPGMRSGLHRHEWVKHGTCYKGRDAQTYYRHSLALMSVLNASEVRQLFAASIGQGLTIEQIRDSFDKAFGRGSGERVSAHCKPVRNRRLIVELRIALNGPIEDALPLSPIRLGALMRNAPTLPSDCASGEVDRAGIELE